MKKTLLSKLPGLIMLSLLLTVAGSSYGQTEEAPENLPVASESSSAEEHFEEEPILFDFPMPSELGENDYTWVVARHKFGLWTIKSSEKVKVNVKGLITKITHNSSWLEGWFLGNFAEVSTEGFGDKNSTAVTIRVTTKLYLNVENNHAGRTYSKSHRFVGPYYYD